MIWRVVVLIGVLLFFAGFPLMWWARSDEDWRMHLGLLCLGSGGVLILISITR